MGTHKNMAVSNTTNKFSPGVNLTLCLRVRQLNLTPIFLMESG